MSVTLHTSPVSGPLTSAVVQPLPNLVVDTVYSIPSRLIPGDLVFATWLARNVGIGASPPSSLEPAWIDSLYFSRDTQLDDTDTLIASAPFTGSPAYSGRPLAGVDNSDSTYFSYYYGNGFWGSQVPDNILGEGYLILKLDSENTVIESNEDDNISAPSPILIQWGNVNLAPSDVHILTEDLAWGSDISLSYNLRNNGTDATTTLWIDSLYFSADPIFDSEDRLLFGWYLGQGGFIGGIGADDSKQLTISSSLPESGSGAQEGYLFVVSNNWLGDHQQVEADYSDNVSEPIPVFIQGSEGVNLTASNLEVSLPSEPGIPLTGNLTWGETINLRWGVQISGSRPTTNRSEEHTSELQ